MCLEHSALSPRGKDKLFLGKLLPSSVYPQCLECLAPVSALARTTYKAPSIKHLTCPTRFLAMLQHRKLTFPCA